MKGPTLDNLWQMFREKQKLNNAPLSQQQALEYAFKCGVAASILMYMDLGKLPEAQANIVVHSIMNEFNDFIRSRMDLSTANQIMQ
jgi:hypothetical protein